MDRLLENTIIIKAENGAGISGTLKTGQTSGEHYNFQDLNQEGISGTLRIVYASGKHFEFQGVN